MTFSGPEVQYCLDTIEELKAQREHDKAVMRQALYALEFFEATAVCSVDTDTAAPVIAALRQRLGDMT